MDLRDSPEEAAFRQQASEFLTAQDDPDLPDYADDQVDDADLLGRQRAWQRILYQNGWASVTWPKAFGGRGCGPIQQIIWNQELSRRGIGESLFMVGIGMAGPTIIACGSDEQKERYLDPILRGDEVWCQLFSEPGAGSDLGAVATRAERDGDDWVVSGQKTWCSGAHYSDFGILLTRSDPKVPKHKGITYFLLDMKSPGIEVRPLVQINRATHFNEVFLDDVRVPDSARLGPVGAGWQGAMTTLMNERLSIAGADRLFSFEALLDHARANSGRVDGVLRDEIGRLYSWMKALDLLNASMITKLGRGEMPHAESSVIKIAMARVVTKASELGVRISGPDAVLRRTFWHNWLLMAPAFHIAGGTDEIQKNVAAERVLGLPAEPRGDRDIPFDELPRS